MIKDLVSEHTAEHWHMWDMNPDTLVSGSTEPPPLIPGSM